jgi:hypothetical protein
VGREAEAEPVQAVLDLLAARKDILQLQGDALALLLDDGAEQVFLVLEVNVMVPFETPASRVMSFILAASKPSVMKTRFAPSMICPRFTGSSPAAKRP